MSGDYRIVPVNSSFPGGRYLRVSQGGFRVGTTVTNQAYFAEINVYEYQAQCQNQVCYPSLELPACA